VKVTRKALLEEDASNLPWARFYQVTLDSNAFYTQHTSKLYLASA